LSIREVERGYRDHVLAAITDSPMQREDITRADELAVDHAGLHPQGAQGLLGLGQPLNDVPAAPGEH
jgi:hypothetical protein